MSVIPIISSAADLEPAIRYAQRNPSSRWYVAKRAASFGVPDAIPDDWGLNVTLASGLPERQAAGRMVGMTAAGWDPNLHPRDRDGRFIEKGDIVQIFDVLDPTKVRFQGKVVGNGQDGDGDYIEVEHDSGLGQQVTRVPADQVKSAPDAKATLKPEADAPAAPEGVPYFSPEGQALEPEPVPYFSEEGQARDLDSTDEGFVPKTPADGPKITGSRNIYGETVVEVEPHDIQTLNGKTLRVAEYRWDDGDNTDQYVRARGMYLKKNGEQSQQGGYELGKTPPNVLAEMQRIRQEKGIGQPDESAAPDAGLSDDAGGRFGSPPADEDVSQEAWDAANDYGLDVLDPDVDRARFEEAADEYGVSFDEVRDAAVVLKMSNDGAYNEAAPVSTGEEDSEEDDKSWLANVGVSAEEYDEIAAELGPEETDAQSVYAEAVIRRLPGNAVSGGQEDQIDNAIENAFSNYNGDYPPDVNEVANTITQDLDLVEDDDLETIREIIDAIAEGSDDPNDYSVAEYQGWYDVANAAGDSQLAKAIDEWMTETDEYQEGPDGESYEGEGDFDEIPITPTSLGLPDDQYIDASSVGTSLSIDAVNAFEPLRGLLDVDNARGAWASGLNQQQLGDLDSYFDDYLDDPESIAPWARNALDQLVEQWREPDAAIAAIQTRRRAANMGWAVEEQLRGILEGETLEEYNPNAVRVAADFVETVPPIIGRQSDEEGNFQTLAKKLREFLDAPAAEADADVDAPDPDNGDLVPQTPEAPPAPAGAVEEPNVGAEEEFPFGDPRDSAPARTFHTSLITSWRNKGRPDTPHDPDDILRDPDPASAHQKLAELSTSLKLGGKQRKRLRELLDSFHGNAATGDSAQVQAAEVADNLSPDNPVKEKLAAKAADLSAKPKTLGGDQPALPTDLVTQSLTPDASSGPQAELDTKLADRLDAMAKELYDDMTGVHSAKLPAGVKKVKVDPIDVKIKSNMYRSNATSASQIELDGENIGTIQTGKVGSSVMSGKVNTGAWKADSSGWLAFDENGKPIRGSGLTASNASEAIALLLRHRAGREIVRRLRAEGKGDQAIREALISRGYGSSEIQQMLSGKLSGGTTASAALRHRIHAPALRDRVRSGR